MEGFIHGLKSIERKNHYKVSGTAPTIYVTPPSDTEEESIERARAQSLEASRRHNKKEEKLSTSFLKFRYRTATKFLSPQRQSSEGNSNDDQDEDGLQKFHYKEPLPWSMRAKRRHAQRKRTRSLPITARENGKNYASLKKEDGESCRLNRSLASIKTSTIEEDLTKEDIINGNSITSPEKDGKTTVKTLFRRFKMIGNNNNLKAQKREDSPSIESFFTGLNQIDHEHDMAKYLEHDWTEFFLNSESSETNKSCINIQEWKRRTSVWELFHSECVYLIDHLLILKDIFLMPLRLLQEYGFLTEIDGFKLFGNIEELCALSSKFCTDLLLVFQSAQEDNLCSTAAVVDTFTDFGWKFHPKYLTYCLNYKKAINYFKSIKDSDVFQEYLKHCQQNTSCRKLKLTDLLIAPIQRLTKYPLILKEIIHYSQEDDNGCKALSSAITAVQVINSNNCIIDHFINYVSLCITVELEEKVQKNLRIELMEELENQIFWPKWEEFTPKAFIPENLKQTISRQPCENFCRNESNRFLYHGPTILIDSSRSYESHLFLFEHLIMIAKIQRKSSSKKQKTNGVEVDGDTILDNNAIYCVYKQPIPLDELRVYKDEEKLTLVHTSKIGQIIGIYTVQFSDDVATTLWLSKIDSAQANLQAFVY
ncbi:Pleckstrin homology domain-containing family G member 7 [Trichoplax sp. H2]|nr:Pleckstrin homology domain-containing family G member 7 [Trichoplax sp. H2]|eukprot:RDD37861.1 Pleckstrin homology domain-containing family G member 7 [Trichoplax sp. H2]